MMRRFAEELEQARVRWRMANPALRGAVQVCAVAALAFAGLTVIRNSSGINETAASILVAVVFGAATVFQQRQSQRRQHTVELITAFQNTERLSTADTWMAARIKSRRAVDPDVPPDDEHQVIAMLDYYEFLAVLALRGLVDVPLLLNQRGGAMTRCFHLCRAYVEDRRETVGPELYWSIDLLTREYERRTGAGASWASGRIVRQRAARPGG